MKQTSTKRRELPVIRLLAVLMLAMMVFAPLAPHATAQDDQAEPKPTQDPALQLPNDPTAPQPSGEETPAATEPPVVEETPEASQGQSTSSEAQITRSTQRNDPATGPGFPAVLAHGLAYVSGDEMVWQVRETDMPSADKARSTTSGAAIMLQRDGSSIVRNDVTGKRAKMDSGEAYFRAAGDGYTVMAEGDTSVVWTFGLARPDDVAMDAFYEGPRIDNLREGVYDMMLTRYVLLPGDQVDLPAPTGAGLVMGATGEIEVDAGGQRSVLAGGDGQTVTDTAVVANPGDSDAVFVYVHLGDEVSDASAGAATGQTTTSTSSETSDAGNEESGETGTPQEAPDTGESSAAPSTDDAGNYITSINVTADAEIYLVITVDGLTVFDGNLPAGSSSGPVVGTTFVVYTSSGENTIFTNACGDTFLMGYEAGEATYTLTASAESCAP